MYVIGIRSYVLACFVMFIVTGRVYTVYIVLVCENAHY